MEKPKNLNGPKVIGKVSIEDAKPEFKIEVESEAINTYEKYVTVVGGAIRLHTNCDSTIDVLMYLLATKSGELFSYDPMNREFDKTNSGRTHANTHNSSAAIHCIIGNVAIAHVNLISIIRHNLAATETGKKEIKAMVHIDIPIAGLPFVLSAIRKSEHPGIDMVFNELVTGYIVA